MTKFTIELEPTCSFRRADQVFTVDLARLSTEIIQQLVYHGITQKVGDAAAGKAEGEATAAMQAVAEALYEGNWGRQRTGGASEEPIMRYIREQVRLMLSPESKAEYKELVPEDKADWLDAKFAGIEDADLSAAIRAAAEEAMAADQRKRDGAKKLAKKLSL